MLRCAQAASNKSREGALRVLGPSTVGSFRIRAFGQSSMARDLLLCRQSVTCPSHFEEISARMRNDPRIHTLYFCPQLYRSGGRTWTMIWRSAHDICAGGRESRSFEGTRQRRARTLTEAITCLYEHSIIRRTTLACARSRRWSKQSPLRRSAAPTRST